MESGVMDQTPFIISETFPIPADKMFGLWTNPEHLGKWFGPAGVKIVRQTMDLRVGGVYHLKPVVLPTTPVRLSRTLLTTPTTVCVRVGVGR